MPPSASVLSGRQARDRAAPPARTSGLGPNRAPLAASRSSRIGSAYFGPAAHRAPARPARRLRLDPTHPVPGVAAGVRHVAARRRGSRSGSGAPRPARRGGHVPRRARRLRLRRSSTSARRSPSRSPSWRGTTPRRERGHPRDARPSGRRASQFGRLEIDLTESLRRRGRPGRTLVGAARSSRPRASPAVTIAALGSLFLIIVLSLYMLMDSRRILARLRSSRAASLHRRGRAVRAEHRRAPSADSSGRSSSWRRSRALLVAVVGHDLRHPVPVPVGHVERAADAHPLLRAAAGAHPAGRRRRPLRRGSGAIAGRPHPGGGPDGASSTGSSRGSCVVPSGCTRSSCSSDSSSAPRSPASGAPSSPSRSSRSSGSSSPTSPSAPSRTPRCPETKQLTDVDEHVMVSVAREQVGDETHPHIHVTRTRRPDGSEQVELQHRAAGPGQRVRGLRRSPRRRAATLQVAAAVS